MRNLKRVLSLALALVMVLGMMVIGTSAATFTDAEEITYTEAVEVMNAIGVIEGYNGKFDPKGDLNRAGAAKLIAYMTMGADAEDYLTGSAAAFSDTEGHWAAKYIAYCSNLGVINGNGDGTFNPDGKISVVGFAKLVLGAAGIEGEYTGANWENNVKTMVAKTPAMKATGIKITTANITREEAAALMLAGMKSGGSETTYYYVVPAAATTTTVNYGKFESVTDAYVLANVMNQTTPGTAKVLIDVDPAGTLLKDVYNVVYKPVDADAFGNPGVGYEKTVDGKKVIDLFYGEEAALTYTANMNNVAGKKAIKADLEAKGVELTERTDDYLFWPYGQATVDNKLDTAAYCGTINQLAGYTADNAVVKVYVEDGEVYLITVAKTYTTTVKTVTEADAEKKIDASITLTAGDLPFKTDAFAKDDVVLYTKAWDGAKYVAQTVVKAASVTGALTGYNSDNVYTIGGETYKVGAGAMVDNAAVKAEINKTKVWHLGVDGGIVAITNVPGEAPVAPSTTYAYITAAKAEADASTDLWGTTTTKGYDVQVKAVLSDGSTGIYKLTAYKNDSQAWVVKVGQAEVAVGSISGLVGKVYPYTLADGVLTLNTALAIFSGAETKDSVVIRDNSAAVTKASTTITVSSGHTVIANNETVFVLAKDLGDASKGLVVKTGLTALEATTIPAWTKVVISVDYNEKTQTATNVAKVVFAQGTEFAASGSVDTSDYIYVDGKYSYSKAEDGTETYAGTAVKVDGTTVAVNGANKTAGIYVLKSDGTIGSVATTTKYTVGVVSGTTVELKAGDPAVSTYVTVGASAKVVSVAEGAALATGAEVYVNADASVVFVVKAAPAN